MESDKVRCETKIMWKSDSLIRFLNRIQIHSMMMDCEGNRDNDGRICCYILSKKKKTNDYGDGLFIGCYAFFFFRSVRN